MSNSSKRVVVFDIDGTLANASHRLYLVKKESGEKKNWSAFFAEAKRDKPYEHILKLNKLYAENGYDIILCTGRPANLRNDTLDWLLEHGIVFDLLLMRLATDRSPDYECKPRTLLECLPLNGYSLNQIEVVFEDRLSVCEAWRNLGLNVLVCGDEWRNTKEAKISES